LTRPTVASAVAVLIGGIAVCGMVMIGVASTSSLDFTSVATRASSVPTATTTMTTATTVVQPSRDTASETGGTEPSSSTTTTVPVPAPTIAPIVTYLADISVLAPSSVAAPTRVIVPALGIDGPVIPVGVNGDSQLDVPPNARTLVWYRYGPSPGGPGSAVIAGHLNWKGTNGIFARLEEVPVGATISVVYDDGTEKDFIATTVELVDKPAVAVNGTFARDGEPFLRLVTCGGEFEKAVRSYRSNVVVTAIPA
jgi:sortase (surface protein transpeptidase)